jgi:hypothetical protein
MFRGLIEGRTSIIGSAQWMNVAAPGDPEQQMCDLGFRLCDLKQRCYYAMDNGNLSAAVLRILVEDIELLHQSIEAQHGSCRCFQLKQFYGPSILSDDDTTMRENGTSLVPCIVLMGMQLKCHVLKVTLRGFMNAVFHHGHYNIGLPNQNEGEQILITRDILRLSSICIDQYLVGGSVARIIWALQLTTEVLAASFADTRQCEYLLQRYKSSRD